MDKERHIDINNLKKYPEFHSLKMELEAFCERMESISDIQLRDDSRVTLSEEVYGRVWASTKVRDLLASLGLVDKKYNSRDMTME